MRTSNYDKYPATVVEGGYILAGWTDILAKLGQTEGLLAVDLYTGVLEEEVIGQLEKLASALLVDTRDLMKPETEILEMTARFMTDDVLFGYLSNLRLEEYFDLSGRRVVPGRGTKGLVIRRSYLSDGTVKTDKLLMK